MIEYVEIRNENRDLIGIIDTAESIIWETAYYSVGRFEIYVQANTRTVAMLAVGNYVTRKDDDNIGHIESINITYTPQSGRMIIASGRLAKSILDRRLIYNLSGTSISPSISRGLVEVAVRKLVTDNIIASNKAARNISFIKLGALQNINKQIMSESGETSQTQTSYGNLLEYTDSLLQTYGLGARLTLDRNTKNLLYGVYEGKDRSVGNTEGNAPVIFSQDFDNLLSSEYKYDTAAFKTTALIGGEGEGTERFCVMVGDGAAGMNRREVFVDAASQSKKYKDDTDTEQTYTDAEYTEILQNHGNQNLAQLLIVQTFNGEIDVLRSGYVYGKDFSVGDIVTINDSDLRAAINTRILTATEVQDANGYMLSVTYGV